MTSSDTARTSASKPPVRGRQQAARQHVDVGLPPRASLTEVSGFGNRRQSVAETSQIACIPAHQVSSATNLQFDGIFNLHLSGGGLFTGCTDCEGTSPMSPRDFSRCRTKGGLHTAGWQVAGRRMVLFSSTRVARLVDGSGAESNPTRHGLQPWWAHAGLNVLPRQIGHMTAAPATRAGHIPVPVADTQPRVRS